MEAREREGMIAHCADVMFRLPHAATLDARPCVQRIDDAPPEDVPCDRGRGNEEAPLRPAANLGLVRSRLAKAELESRPCGAELRRRCDGEVELQCVWQQEYAVDGRPRFEVGELYRVQFLGERARPAVENVRDRHTVSDPESEVQVGEAVAASDSERANSSSGDDALVFLRELEHSRTQRVSLFDREHQPGDPSSAELAGSPSMTTTTSATLSGR